jgi:hypothetical protein
MNQNAIGAMQKIRFRFNQLPKCWPLSKKLYRDNDNGTIMNTKSDAVSKLNKNRNKETAKANKFR